MPHTWKVNFRLSLTGADSSKDIRFAKYTLYPQRTVITGTLITGVGMFKTINLSNVQARVRRKNSFDTSSLFCQSHLELVTTPSLKQDFDISRQYIFSKS